MPKGLLVLCAYLLAWVPVNFALLATRSLPSLETRGSAALIELSADAMVTMVCVVAGRVLWVRHAAGRPLAVGALLLSAAASVQSVCGSALPHDIPPGFTGPLMIAAVANAAAWTTYLYQSKRVRTWLES